jgi:hypothetical protein
MKKKIFIGLHVHKAAGTTLQIHFEQHLRSHLVVTSPIVNYQFGRVFFDELPKAALPKKQVIWGHDVQESMLYDLGRDYFLFTFLREPVERVISWYKYEHRKRGLKQSFENFVGRHANFMCKMIISAFPSLDTSGSDDTADKALSILEKFNFIGTQENFAEHSRILLDYIGVPPISEAFRANENPKGGSSKYDNNLVKEFNQDDIKLYERIFKGVPSQFILNESANAAGFIRGKKAAYSDTVLKRLHSELSDLAHHKMLKERYGNDMAVILRRLCSMYLITDEDSKDFIKRMIILFQRKSGIRVEMKKLNRRRKMLQAKQAS